MCVWCGVLGMRNDILRFLYHSVCNVKKGLKGKTSKYGFNSYLNIQDKNNTLLDKGDSEGVKWPDLRGA